ncbi:MAG: polyhydroxyalkanoic acid system family protein [Minisyncoccia bacterium]
MQLTLKHNESQAAAVARIKNALKAHRAEILKNAPDADTRWEGNVLHFAATMQKQHFSGTLTVLDRQFDVDLKLPLMMRMFEGRIKKQIEEQAKGLLK